MAKEILINQLFSGGYLYEGDNIGHEIINFFSDDEGYINLYITSDGRINGHEDLQYILFVRNYLAKKTVEIVGLAYDFYPISGEEMKRVKYAGLSLDQIFKNNTYHGIAEDPSRNVTIRARAFKVPSKKIFLTIDDSFSTDEVVIKLDTVRKVIIPQSFRAYYSEANEQHTYDQLKRLINNPNLWEAKNTPEKLFPEGAIQNQSPSFLEVIRKEDDENIFSNLLAYYFEYSHQTFRKFAVIILGIKDMGTSFNVYRETKGHIDLLIESENDIIVIENKIKSGINGIVGDDYSQLNNYHDWAKREAENNNKQPHFYIFAPDYARFDLGKYGLTDTYKIIHYSELYSFFISEAEVFIADRAFPDFIRGLKRHTLTFPELQFDTMRSRLLRRINQLQ